MHMAVNSFLLIDREIESLFPSPPKINSFAGKNTLFLASEIVKRGTGAQPATYSFDTGGGGGAVFPGDTVNKSLKLTTRQVPRAENTNEWRCIFTPQYAVITYTRTTMHLTYIQNVPCTPAKVGINLGLSFHFIFRHSL